MIPKLTVALMTYNRRNYLRQSMDAILGQTWGDFEFLVLDNHSSDDTADLVLSYKDDRLVYVRQAPGGNPSTNNFSAQKLARGKLIMLTHDDDVVEPTMLEKQMSFMARHPEVLTLATNVSLIDGEGNLIQRHLYDMAQDRIFTKGTYVRAYLEEKLWLPTPTLIHQREWLLSMAGKKMNERVGRYFSSIDILFLCKQNLFGPVAILAEPLLRYRQHAGQESRNVDQSSPLAELTTALLRMHARIPRMRREMPGLHGFKARFRSQHLLFTHGHAYSRQRLEAVLRGYKEDWEQAVPLRQRAMDAVLPFEILIGEAGLGTTLSAKGLESLAARPALNGAQQGYRNWTQVLRKGGTLFEGKGRPARIAVFGSMLTAHLLVLDARRAGVELVCCLDSSPARIGRKVFNVPIVPMTSLANLAPGLDAVILSSERDQEASIIDLLEPHLPHRALPVLSWKALAAEAMARPQAVCR